MSDDARILLCLGVFLVLSSNPAPAVPLKTDRGEPVKNWVFFPNGIPAFVIPPGSVEEDGTGPPSKVTKDTQEKEYTTAERDKIVRDDKTAHPSITVAGQPTPAYDCHGFTFKSGTLWIDNPEVDKILRDQAWKKRGEGGTPAAAMKGDIVIYRNAAGEVTHSGIVEDVDGSGRVTKVRSKWGGGGLYIHDPTDVPPTYGSLQVYTGGKPLADPTIADEDVNVFGGITPPPLKAALIDPFVNPQPPIEFNDFPVPSLEELTHGPTSWGYGLNVPQLGLTISSGDRLELFGTGWIGASVSANALSPSFGAWEVEAVLSNVITFEATSSAFLPGDFTGLIDGFAGTTLPTPVGEIVYRESVAGSVGLVSGPSSIPEPSVLATFGLAAVGLFWASRRSPRERHAVPSHPVRWPVGPCGRDVRPGG